jgi:hypothetical protein
VKLAPEPYSSGFPFALIDDIQGRTEDILYFPGLNSAEVAVHPIVFHHVMDTVPTNGWQIVQGTNGLTLLLSRVRGAFLDDILVEQIQQALANQGVVVPPISVQHVDAIPKAASGKAPLIQSKLTPVSPNKRLQRLAKVEL